MRNSYGIGLFAQDSLSFFGNYLNFVPKYKLYKCNFHSNVFENYFPSTCRTSSNIDVGVRIVMFI